MHSLEHQGRFLHFYKSESGWEYVRRPGRGTAVSIIAVTSANAVILVEQLRQPFGRLAIELPSGLVDGDEDHATAAIRELEEETGYGCRAAEPLCLGATSAGLTDEMLEIFLARGVSARDGGAVEHLPDGTIRHREERGAAGENERIIVHEVPLGILASWLARKQSEGLVIDLKVFLALYRLRNDG